jgi:hypothetical protein
LGYALILQEGWIELDRIEKKRIAAAYQKELARTLRWIAATSLPGIASIVEDSLREIDLKEMYFYPSFMPAKGAILQRFKMDSATKSTEVLERNNITAEDEEFNFIDVSEEFSIVGDFTRIYYNIDERKLNRVGEVSGFGEYDPDKEIDWNRLLMGLEELSAVAGQRPEESEPEKEASKVNTVKPWVKAEPRGFENSFGIVEDEPRDLSLSNISIRPQYNSDGLNNFIKSLDMVSDQPFEPFGNGKTRVVLVAEAGTGKSFFMKRAALAFLENDSSDIEFIRNTFGEEMLKGNDSKDRLLERGAIFLALREKKLTGGLLNELVENASTMLPNESVDDIEETMKDLMKECIVFLDGLDEMGQSPDVMCRELGFEDVSYVVSTRISAFYQEIGIDLSKPVRCVSICPMSREEQESFIVKWFSVAFTSKNKRGRVEQVLEVLRKSQFNDIAEMLTSPLLAICLIQQCLRGTISNDKTGLFTNVCHTLIEWRSAYITRSSNFHDYMIIFSYIAYKMAKKRVLHVNEIELYLWLGVCRQSFSFLNPDFPEQAAKIIIRIDMMISSVGMMFKTPYGEHFKYDFQHKSFFEFFAAYAIAMGLVDDEDMRLSASLRFAKHAEDENWFNIIAFGASLLNSREREKLIRIATEKKASRLALSLLENGITVTPNQFSMIAYQQFAKSIFPWQSEMLYQAGDSRYFTQLYAFLLDKFQTHAPLGKTDFLYSFAQIHFIHLVKTGENPFEKAIELIHCSSYMEKLTGALLLKYYAWAHKKFSFVPEPRMLTFEDALALRDFVMRPDSFMTPTDFSSMRKVETRERELKIRGPELSSKDKEIGLIYRKDLPALFDLEFYKYTHKAFLKCLEKSSFVRASWNFVLFPITEETVKFSSMVKTPEAVVKMFREKYDSPFYNRIPIFYTCALIGSFGGYDRIQERIDTLTLDNEKGDEYLQSVIDDLDLGFYKGILPWKRMKIQRPGSQAYRKSGRVLASRIRTGKLEKELIPKFNMSIPELLDELGDDSLARVERALFYLYPKFAEEMLGAEAQGLDAEQLADLGYQKAKEIFDSIDVDGWKNIQNAWGPKFKDDNVEAALVCAWSNTKVSDFRAFKINSEIALAIEDAYPMIPEDFCLEMFASSDFSILTLEDGAYIE